MPSGRHGRKVIRSDGKTYPSVAVASEDTGIPATNIYRAINRTNRSAGGFGWAYASRFKGTPVFVDGKLVGSIKEAADRIGTNKGYVSRALKFGDGLVKGHQVRYAFMEEVTCPCCGGRGTIHIEECG